MQPNLEEQYDKIYRYCYVKLGNRELAEDLTQETFLKSLESERFLAGGCPLAFLYTVARNLCIDEYRRKKPQQMEEETLAFFADTASEHVWHREEQLLDTMVLRQALLELDEPERELVLLRYVGEVPAAQQWLGISRFTLYRRTKQILKKLERRLSDETKQKTTAERGAETDL